MDSIESFYLKNLKRILGVPQSTANSAVYHELGQTSILVMVKQSLMDFLCKLKQDPANYSLLQSLLSIDCNWTRFCLSVLQPHELTVDNICPFALPIKDLREIFMEKVLQEINSMSSLRFLNKFKMDGGFIQQMDCILNHKHRSAINKLRCGSFNTRSRFGAWLKEAKEDRTCRFCDLGCLEDEEHILSQCTSFGSLRKTFQEEADNCLQEGSQYPFDLKFFFNNTQLLPVFAKFIYKTWLVVADMNKSIMKKSSR
jgi:hypothetical protein